jgi:hypothetical protein
MATHQNATAVYCRGRTSAGRRDFSGGPDGVYRSPAVGRVEVCLAALSVNGSSTKLTNIMIGALPIARAPDGL